MGTLRLQPARLAAFTPRAMGNVWSVFDLQLAVYALALVVIGLLMAFTNSGDAPLTGGSLFTRALMWLAIAIVIFTVVRRGRLPLVADLRVAALPHQHRPAGADHRHRQRHRRRFALGHHPGAPVPVLRGGQGPHGHRAGHLDREPSRADHEPAGPSSGAVLLALPPLVLVLIQPDLGTSLVIGAILFGSLFVSGASLRWLTVGVVMVLAFIPIAWTEILKPYQKERLISFLDPIRRPAGLRATSCSSPRSRSAPAGLFGTRAHQRHDGRRLPARPVDRLRLLTRR